MVQNSSSSSPSQMVSSSGRETKENNMLLKDLIKILVIKELQTRQNVRRFPYTYGNLNPYYQINPPYIAN